MSPRDAVSTQLPKSMSQTRRDEIAEQILDSLASEDLLLDAECTVVEVGDARLPVETIEAYGLTIKLDANGDASEISHPSGLVVIG